MVAVGNVVKPSAPREPMSHENGHVDRWLRPASVMRRLDISRATLLRYIRCGKVIGKKLPSGHVRVLESSMMALLQEYTEK